MFNETNTPREYMETGDAACIMYHACAKRDDLNIYDDDAHRGIHIALENLIDLKLVTAQHFGLPGKGLTTIKPTDKGVAEFVAHLRAQA